MICESTAHAKLIFKRFLNYPRAAFDTETKARAPWKGKKDALVLGRMQIIVFSMCYKGEAYCFPTNLLSGEYCSIHDYLQMPEFQRILREKLIVMHNSNYDINVLDAEDPEVRIKNWFDTMIGGWLANPAREKTLKSHAPYYGRHLHKTSTIDFSKQSDIAPYAEEDVVQTDECYEMQHFGKLFRPRTIFYIRADGTIKKKRNKLPAGKVVVEKAQMGEFEKVFYRYHEHPYLKTTIAAEKIGFPFNPKKARRIRKKIERKKARALKRIYRKARGKLNLKSHKQKAELFQNLGIVSPNVSRKTGKPSYAAGALIKIQMAGGHPIISDLQNFSSLDRLGDYVDLKKGLPYYRDHRGRIRATANTCGAITGRGSCSNPNLQQTPAAKDIFGIKDCFEAPKGYKIICLDHRQLELRVMAILAQEFRMADILNDPSRDIHQEMADEANVDRDPTAKQLNFLLQYAGTAWALAEKLTIEGVPTTPQQAQVWVDRYGAIRPCVLAYREELLTLHEQQGYVQLLTGRKRWLEGVRWDSYRDRHKAETTLSNNIVQGSGQDLLKASIIRCDWKRQNMDRAIPGVLQLKRSHRLLLKDYARRVEKLRGQIKLGKCRFVLQVHDEALYFAENSAAEDCGNHVAEIMCMKHYFQPIVPYNTMLAVEGGIGDTWKQAKGKTPIAKIEKMATYLN